MRFLTKIAFALLLGYVPHASAQQITGRFYPEKQQYLVGEPVIIDFEVVNGSSKVFETSEDNCFHGYFEVDNAAPKKRVRLFGCPKPGMSGDCLFVTRQIPAGQTYQKRFLLVACRSESVTAAATPKTQSKFTHSGCQLFGPNLLPEFHTNEFTATGH